MSKNDLVNRIREITSREKVITISLILSILFLPALVFLVNSSQKQEIRTNANINTVSSLNTQILENNISNKKIVNFSILEQRKSEMKKLAYENPKEFLEAALTQDLRDTFPEDQKTLIEEKVHITGNLIKLHKDNFKSSTADRKYLVQEGGNTYFLSMDDDFSEEELIAKSEIEIDGYRLDKQIVASKSNTILSQSTSPSRYVDTVKFLVLPFYFSDDNSRPYSTSEIENLLYSGNKSVNKYYNDLSNGTVGVKGVVKPWKLIPGIKASEICSDEGLNKMSDYVNANYPYYDYFGIIMIFPEQDCTWDGAGTIGGSPAYVWINLFDLRTMAHEVGHSFGLDHASLLECTSIVCGNKEYGDWSDNLGDHLASLNGAHRLALGYLKPSDVQRISENGIYTIYDLDSNNKPKLIRIVDPNSKWDIFIEHRNLLNKYDAGVEYDLNKGVALYRWSGNQNDKTKLLDITPGDGNKLNLVLKDGQQIKLSSPKIIIKTISHTLNTAKVQIRKY